jgi:effector-binding domain-containing protein
MEFKNTDVGSILRIRRNLTIPEVGPQSAECCGRIYEKAEEIGACVVGPWHFISHRLPKDIETRFIVDFCLPISGITQVPNGDDIELDTLSDFYCASRTFEGSLHQLFEMGYQPLIEEINAVNLECSGESREVYHTWEGPDSENNVVEIQFGLAATPKG